MCANKVGSNSVAFAYFDSMCDALRQHEMLEGMSISCNPPYDYSGKFIRTLIKSFDKNQKTRAVLVVPYREGRQWWKDLVKDPRFRQIGYHASGTQVFTAADSINPYRTEDRIECNPTKEVITVWEMRLHAATYAKFTFKDAIKFEGNLIAAM